MWTSIVSVASLTFVGASLGFVMHYVDRAMGKPVAFTYPRQNRIVNIIVGTLAGLLAGIVIAATTKGPTQ